MSEQEEWEYYNSHVQDLNKIEVVRIVINVKVPIAEHTEELPLHLINELIRTEKGRKFLEIKRYVERSAAVIDRFVNSIHPIPSAAEVRSTLWSIGFFGSRNKSIKILKQNGVFDNIIRMTFHSHILSLRGTCRYILNMFSHSEHGRNLLTDSGFNVNSSCFTCYPAETKKFYSIPESSEVKKHFIMDEGYWNSYSSLQKPMNKCTCALMQTNRNYLS